jgi:hypothetical protein
MKTLKMFIIVVQIFVFALALKAQTFKADYEYDANGNRLKASVTYLSIKSVQLAKDEDVTLKVDAIDSTTNCKISIYPNPTQSDLYIEISGLNLSDSPNKDNYIRILDLKGQLIVSEPINSPYIPIDLSKFPDGTYVVVISIQGKDKQYKIIKTK